MARPDRPVSPAWAARRKLSMDDVATIRRSAVSSRLLARLLGVSHTVIVKARQGVTYKAAAGNAHG